MSDLAKGIGQEDTRTGVDSPTRELRYAGFWIRFVALVLDLLALNSFFVIMDYIAGINTDSLSAYAFFQFIFIYIYFVIFTLYGGQTLGKMILGIQVIRVDLQPNQWGHIIIREFPGKIVSALILFIGYIMAAFDSQKRALHDRMASTVVVWK